jgi:hypothetical protein
MLLLQWLSLSSVWIGVEKRLQRRRGKGLPREGKIGLISWLLGYILFGAKLDFVVLF